MGTRGGAVGRVDREERGEKVGEVARECDVVIHGCNGCEVTIDPGIDRPREREVCTRRHMHERARDEKWELGREERKPTMFLLDLRRVPLGTRQPYRHRRAEPKRSVVPALMLDRSQCEVDKGLGFDLDAITIDPPSPACGTGPTALSNIARSVLEANDPASTRSSGRPTSIR